MCDGHWIGAPSTVGMVPALVDNSLLSRGKFAEAGYGSVCYGKDVNIYDGRTQGLMCKIGVTLRFQEPYVDC